MAKQYDRFIVDGKEMQYMGHFLGIDEPKEYCFRVHDDVYINVPEAEIKSRMKAAIK